MARTFSAQVDDWTRKSKARMTAVFRESTQRLSEEANLAKGEGGRLPVDTGFLRASFSVSLSGLPFGVSQGDRSATYTFDDSAVDLVIASAQIGDTIFGGWVANYANVQEEQNAFLRGAVQNWQGIVDGVVREVSVRFP